MPSEKNPFLTFRNLETDKMTGINIHNITSYHERIAEYDDDKTKPYVLVLCVDDRYGRKIDISFKDFQAKIRAWYSRSA